MKFNFKVEGTELVTVQIQKLGKYKPEINRCINKTLAEMKNRANTLTPKRTGELRNSAYGHTTGDLEAEFGYTKFYAPFVEYGHRIVFYGRQVGYKPANPFLEPNARAQASIFASDCERAISMLVR